MRGRETEAVGMLSFLSRTTEMALHADGTKRPEDRPWNTGLQEDKAKMEQNVLLRAGMMALQRLRQEGCLPRV